MPKPWSNFNEFCSAKFFDRSKSKNTDDVDRLEALLEELLSNDGQYKNDSVRTTIACAQNIMVAHDEFTGKKRRQYWRAFCKRSYHASDITFYLTIASNPHLTNPSNWQYLPAGFSILYPIARLTQNDSPAEFQRRLWEPPARESWRLCEGIHPKITRTQANDLLAQAQGKATSRDRNKAARNKHATEREHLHTLNEIRQQVKAEREWRQALYPDPRIDQEANLLRTYLESLMVEYRERKINKNAFWWKVCSILATSKAAKYAIWSAWVFVSDATEKLKQTIQECSTLAEISDVTRFDVSPKAMAQAEADLRAFVAAENLKIQPGFNGDDNEVHMDGFADAETEFRLIDTIKTFLKTHKVHGVDVKVGITQRISIFVSAAATSRDCLIPGQ